MTSYCSYSRKPGAHPLHKEHHSVYGFPMRDDGLFGRLCMEINQAGLNWETILKKEATLRKAYRSFNVDKIAKFSEKDVKRLLNDPGIIRNRLKVHAIIHNAKVIKAMGGFEKWLDEHHPLSRDEWTKLFKRTFKFAGGEIVNEFLISVGYLPGAHDKDCPLYKKVLAKRPAWSRNA